LTATNIKMRLYSFLISIPGIAFVHNSKWDTSCLTLFSRLPLQLTEINWCCQISSQPTYSSV